MAGGPGRERVDVLGVAAELGEFATEARAHYLVALRGRQTTVLAEHRASAPAGIGAIGEEA
jgi:hypothetical protein